MAFARFQVQGSGENVYDLIFVAKDRELTALCNCKAGEMGSFCKHRVRILEGFTDGILSKNESQVEQVCEWLNGTPLAAALEHYNDCIVAVEGAKNDLKRAKKALARILNGH
jgi:hypothetical protein